MKHWILAPLVTISLNAIAQAPALIGKIPTEEDCLGLIAVLPTFESEKMKTYLRDQPESQPSITRVRAALVLVGRVSLRESVRRSIPPECPETTPRNRLRPVHSSGVDQHLTCPFPSPRVDEASREAILLPCPVSRVPCRGSVVCLPLSLELLETSLDVILVERVGFEPTLR